MISGDKYLEMTAGGDATYNLPWFEYGDCYEIKDGDFLLIDTGDNDASRPLFSFCLLTTKSMEVYCHKSGETFKLYKI